MDKLVPHLEAGLETIAKAGYKPVVRNLGGLAVVADQGILNFTLLFPQDSVKFEIKEVYQLMADLVSKILINYGCKVEVGEVPQSYCPGNFDLSISGKKFAGLAQRRIGRALAISIYLSVSGDQAKRGQIVQQFYQEGIRREETNFQYPDVDPTCMATLSELLGKELSVNQVVQDLKETLSQLGARLKNYEVTSLDQERYYEYLDKK
ncbi:protein--protein lipoyl transferase [Streptococcus sp. X16XC17]|uniref:lipoate--protein ligase family protein n=2 Tax=unclassified Streptococcus TaxID=2608887 RepID=UPI0013F14475|nr:protein--protein lipoyl transferase [Streptococcus sp. X16XC17]